MMDIGIILASKSPRRKEILELAGIPFTVMVKEVEEIYPDDLPVREIPEYLALLKANAVKDDIQVGQLVIASDTIVLMNNKVYGKPRDRAEAIAFLKELSGNMHEVITGVCLLSTEKEHTFAVATKVYFKQLTPDEIEHYVDRYQPYDKAGAYAIQEWIGLTGIEKIEGCYFNVVGLPMSKLYHELKQF